MQVELEQRGQKLVSFEEIVETTVDAKAKAAFKPRSYACNTNQYCLRDCWPSPGKTNTQGQSMIDPWVEEPKLKFQEQKALVFQRFNSAETSEQARKEKKKKEKRERRNREKRPQDTTPATGVNITNIFGGHSSGIGGWGGKVLKEFRSGHLLQL